MDGRPAKEADALTIALVMLIQQCLSAAGRGESNPAHIVGMVRPFPPIRVCSSLAHVARSTPCLGTDLQGDFASYPPGFLVSLNIDLGT